MFAKISRGMVGAMFLVATLVAQTASAIEPIADKRVAAKIAKEKGVLRPAEVLQWTPLAKDIQKDWIKIDNKYFSVSYPKCFSIQADGGEEDPKISPEIILKRGQSCPGYISDFGESNWFSIGFEYLRQAKEINILSTLWADWVLSRQEVAIGNLQAFLVAGALDSFNEKDKSYSLGLRWQIIVKCKNKVYFAVIRVPPGKAAVDRVNRNDYQIPEDFKEIVSTFQCK